MEEQAGADASSEIPYLTVSAQGLPYLIGLAVDLLINNVPLALDLFMMHSFVMLCLWGVIGNTWVVSWNRKAGHEYISGTVVLSAFATCLTRLTFFANRGTREAFFDSGSLTDHMVEDAGFAFGAAGVIGGFTAFTIRRMWQAHGDAARPLVTLSAGRFCLCMIFAVLTYVGSCLAVRAYLPCHRSCKDVTLAIANETVILSSALALWIAPSIIKASGHAHVSAPGAAASRYLAYTYAVLFSIFGAVRSFLVATLLYKPSNYEQLLRDLGAEAAAPGPVHHAHWMLVYHVIDVILMLLPGFYLCVYYGVNINGDEQPAGTLRDPITNYTENRGLPPKGGKKKKSKGE
eukprot:jgi/Mesvir1/948/Mv17502-RA.1